MAESIILDLSTQVIKLLVEELNEISEFQFQRQLGSLERELRLMLAVLDHIESLEGPDEAMKGWAENAREVVRSVEDMIDSFMFKRAKTSGEKILMRTALRFMNEIFFGYKLSPKVKRLLLRINDLSKKSRVLNIGKDGRGEESRDRGEEGDGESSNSPSPNFQIIYKEKYPKMTFEFGNRCPWPPVIILLTDSFTKLTDIVIPGTKSLIQVMNSPIYDLLRVRHQILNVRKDRGDPEELEVTISREEDAILESNTIISSFLEQIDSVLSQKFLLYPFATWEVKQVKQCLSDLLKHMKAVRELDEREKVWWEWVRKICITAKDFLTSFISKREEQMETLAKLKATTLPLRRASGTILKATTLRHADSELRTEMMVMRSRIQYAYGRRWIYGMGESDKKREGLTPSTGFELESISQELKLMHALFKDVQGMEVQGGRGKAWLKQMEDLALEVDDFSRLIQLQQEKMKGRSCLSLYCMLSSIAKKIEEMSGKFYVMSKRKMTYDIGKFEGKKGQYSQIQDLQGTTASISGTTAEGDDNNLEEGQRGSSQQHTKATRYVGEIEEIGNNYDIGKFEGKRVQCSTVQDLPGTSASMSNVIVKNVDNHLETAQPGFLQQDTQTITAEPSQMNVLIDTRLPTSDTVGRSYAKEQVESIKRELELINGFLEDVEVIKEPDARLNYWEEEMREIAQEAKAIVGIYEKARVERKSNSKVVREISIINEKIMKFTHRRIAYGIEHVEESNLGTRRRYQRSPSSQYSEESVVIGFDDRVNEIKERLLADKPNLCVISIVGIEGSGKTALATLIYNDNAARFDIHAWVSISEKHSAEDILEEIRKNVKGKRSITEELRGKRYLIVLDNISMAGIWDDVKDAFPDESNRSRIVITTRDMAVPPHADSRISQYKLHLLSTDESWTLFTNSFQKEVPKEQEKLLRKMLRSCGGLSLAIVKLGKLLSEKVPTELSDTDKEESEISGEGPWSEISDKVSRELPLELKGCLNYFLLFPKEFDIPARRLITLWIAEGLLSLGRGNDSPEKVAEMYLMELIDRNMVQVTEKKPNGKVRTCCLPVALRKLLLKAIDKVSKGQVNTASKSSSSLQQIRWIVDYYNNKESSNTSFNHIHGDNTDIATLQASYRKSLSFMSFDYREGSQPGDEIGNFLQRCISGRSLLLLRVLDLERVFRPQLPKVLSTLVLLRYLGLRWTYLESLPSSISNLLKLQTLDVKHTYISSLPRSIWKMQRLRHLYLSESYRSRFGPRPKGVLLTDLQTLWGAFVDEKSPVKDGLDTLINLRKLGVACRRMSDKEEDPMSDKEDPMSLQLKAVADWIEKLKHLQCLRLKSHDENNQPWHLHWKSLSGHENLSSVYFLGRLNPPSVKEKFPKNLIELTLSASKLKEEEDPMQALGELPELRILQLFSESYEGKEMKCLEKSFPKLRVLKLWNLEELEKWTVLGGALPCLRDLEIRSCPKLHKLPDGLQHVTSLQELKLSNMPTKFTELIKTKDCNGEDWGKRAHVRVSIEP